MNHCTTVIPVFNGARFIGATLESVARQTRRPDRLVILDDCSTDGTVAILEKFQKEHPDLACDVIRNPVNLGLFGNLNRTLDFASETEHLHILLADDLICPDFLYRLVGVLEPVPGFALAYSLTEAIDQSGATISPPRISDSRRSPVRITLHNFLVRQSELQTVLCGSVVFKTCSTPFPVKFRMDMPQTADCVFYSEAALRCAALMLVPEVLCQIRSHPFSATSRNVKSLQAWVLDEWKAIQMSFALIQEPRLARWIRSRKLKCLFAARSVVKVQVTRDSNPEYAREIAAVTRKIVGGLAWVLGKMAVGARDAVCYFQTKRRQTSNSPNNL